MRGIRILGSACRRCRAQAACGLSLGIPSARREAPGRREHSLTRAAFRTCSLVRARTADSLGGLRPQGARPKGNRCRGAAPLRSVHRFASAITGLTHTGNVVETLACDDSMRGIESSRQGAHCPSTGRSTGTRDSESRRAAVGAAHRRRAASRSASPRIGARRRCSGSIRSRRRGAVPWRPFVVCVTSAGCPPGASWWQRSPPPGGDCARMSVALWVSASGVGPGAIHERVPCHSRTMRETAGRPPGLPHRRGGGVASQSPERTTLRRPAGAPPDVPHEMSRAPHDHAPGAEATTASLVRPERAE
jgi:hypothetical protein